MRQNVSVASGKPHFRVQEECVEQLAYFFPLTKRIRVAARVTALRAGGKELQERVTLEFGGKDHAIFLSRLPIEFDDKISLVCLGDGTKTEATVVAVQYHDESKAVAVRVTNGHCGWDTQR